MEAIEFLLIWSAPAERKRRRRFGFRRSREGGEGWLPVSEARSARSQSGVALRLPPQSIPSRCFLRYPYNLCLPAFRLAFYA